LVVSTAGGARRPDTPGSRTTAHPASRRATPTHLRRCRVLPVRLACSRGTAYRHNI